MLKNEITNYKDMKEEDNLNNPKFDNPSERQGYRKGFKAGYNEGMKKVALLIQLLASNSEDFEESIIQNSREAIALRKLMIGTEQEDA
jgi:Uncharacterized protein conserved in bacteria